MTGTRIIKRYQNRKLYDTQASSYITMDEITKARSPILADDAPRLVEVP